VTAGAAGGHAVARGRGVRRRLPPPLGRGPHPMLHADHDVRVPVAVGEAMEVAVRGSEFVVLTGPGHVSPVEDPDAVTRELRRFLRSVERSRRLSLIRPDRRTRPPPPSSAGPADSGLSVFPMSDRPSGHGGSLSEMALLGGVVVRVGQAIRTSLVLRVCAVDCPGRCSAQETSRRMIRRGIPLATASVVPTTRNPARSNIPLVPTNAMVRSIRPGGSTGNASTAGAPCEAA
jgi:hypothetical protein